MHRESSSLATDALSVFTLDYFVGYSKNNVTMKIQSSSPSSKNDLGPSWTEWVREQAFLAVILAVFVRVHYSIIIMVLYLLFQLLNTDHGRKCLLTLKRDLTGGYLLVSVRWKLKQAFKRNAPVHEYFLEKVQKHPDKECIVEIETGRKFTFREINALANKYANYFQKNGYHHGDVVALFMDNSADFFALWLGLSKIGVITAWINSNLKMEPLIHSIKVSKCKSVVVAQNLLPTLQTASKQDETLEKLPKFLVENANVDNDLPVLYQLISEEHEPKIPTNHGLQSVLCYIYTSGTTGNPKPAVIKHFRLLWFTYGPAIAWGFKPEDRLYVHMPMYHSQAGLLGIGQIINLGMTAVIRKKFSASNFWKDCVKYNCTTSQYIGEITRYLLAQKPIPEERMHNMRVMIGNGLRPDLWKEFVKRFGVKIIGEHYGSTEGNSSIVNLDNHPGACGFMPIYSWATTIYPIKLIKVDPETDQPIRDDHGLCIPCRPGDTGEMVGMIKKDDPLSNFEGYVGQEDTQKKLIRDVVEKGDVFATSGDLLYWDEYGYLYFKDRRGETYRWKGENVSTSEVETVLKPISSIVDIAVYGVEIPGREGRAGMIGMHLAEGSNLENVLIEAASRLQSNLAAYAIPVFLRLCKEVDKTGTFKVQKNKLQKDGFKLETCNGDPVYYWDVAQKCYKPMDKKMQEDIISGAYNKF